MHGHAWRPATCGTGTRGGRRRAARAAGVGARGAGVEGSANVDGGGVGRRRGARRGSAAGQPDGVKFALASLQGPPASLQVLRRFCEMNRGRRGRS